MTIRFLLISFLLSQYFTAKSQDSTYRFYGGTSVIARISKDTIWVATDSKFSLPASPYTTEIPRTVQKVRWSPNNIYFTLAGSYLTIISLKKSTNKIDTVLDVATFISKIISKCKNIDQAFSQITTLLPNKFDSAILTFPHQISDRIRQNQHVKIIELLLMKYENGLPKYKLLTFSYITQENNIIFRYIDLTPKNQVLPTFEFLGYADVGLEYIKQERFTSTNVKSMLTNAIKLEIALHPDACGEPVQILAITKKGHYWISKL